MTSIQTQIEIVVFSKDNGPLTKRISLNGDGKIKSDGSECVMSSGTARRVHLGDVTDLAKIIDGLKPNQAIGLGALRVGLLDVVKVVTKTKLIGSTHSDVIARTGDSICYRVQQPAPVLLDFDTKGMPPEVRERIDTLGGFWPAVVSILPEIERAASVVRLSTSSGLSRTDTVERIEGSGGVHVYIIAKDGSDARRFLKTLHDRSWLHGLGWYMLGEAGQFLERSIVDRMVYAAERLVFEGAPVLDYPLRQDGREPVAHAGEVVDTLGVCPTLTVVEKAKLEKLKAEAKLCLAPESKRARDAFVDTQAEKIAIRTGKTQEEARRTAERMCEGVLLPHVVLHLDDGAIITVADILGDPGKYDGVTLADPLEGPSYGWCKSKIMRRRDGTPWIRSFAHGLTTYELNFDANTAREQILNADDPIDAFVKFVLAADIDEVELQRLIEEVAEKARCGKRALQAVLKRAKQKQYEQRKQEARERDFAEDKDPRPRLPVPDVDAPWLPVMATIDEALMSAPLNRRTRRNLRGSLVRIQRKALRDMHALGNIDLPAPEQYAIVEMAEPVAAEEIERHINYVDKERRSVHLPGAFVTHYRMRDGGPLPIMATIAALPIVLRDGRVLAMEDGIDVDSQTAFIVPREVLTLVPKRDACTPDAVERAMAFLMDEWLIDVSTDYVGKCLVIAAALTLIERIALPVRPTFFLSAGRQGTGKTTLMRMIIRAVCGVDPSAAGWSDNEEERRKKLFSYLLAGAPYIAWDNIARGAQLSCPHIERACTSRYYSDRLLGSNDAPDADATAIHFFTGNNISPRGDLTSRSLIIRLETDRPDPENREFRHPESWTETNRAKILAALYTILIGNPALYAAPNAPAKTRFKEWHRLVGSAVENAAQQQIDFEKVFKSQAAEDEEDVSLGEALAALRYLWPTGFSATDVCTKLANGNLTGLEGTALIKLADFFATGRAGVAPTAKSVGKALSLNCSNPVQQNGTVMTLKRTEYKGTFSYEVKKQDL